MRLLLFVICLALPVALVAMVVAESQQPPEVGREQQLPTLFNFGHYKRIYGKVYRSLSEELSRRRLVMARALRAFVSGIKYKFRQTSSYLALNHLSDRAPEELERRTNRVLAEQSKKMRLNGRESEVNDDDDDENQGLPELLPAEHEDVEREVGDYLRQHDHELGIDAAGRRRKRDASLKPRDLSLDQLVNRPLVSQPARVRIKSNNPHYEPIEVASFGLRDQQEDVLWIDLSRPLVVRTDQRPVNEQLSAVFSGIKLVLGDTLKSSKAAGNRAEIVNNRETNSDHEPDQMYVDHRDCMNPPRDQGECGACYAFTGMAIMEWLYCTKTGVRNVAFSEQYMIDCGNGRFPKDKMDGCDGASDEYVSKFIHNFGLELLSNYPYIERDGHCPYKDDYDLKKTGYIRMRGLDRAVYVPVNRFPKYLKRAPLYIGFATGREFNEYGGGLVEERDCGQVADHAMLLVGHGRHEGREYYLIRNSYGTDWGEGGYMRLARDAARKCIEETGNMLGTVDGINLPVTVHKTEDLERERLEKLARKEKRRKTG